MSRHWTEHGPQWLVLLGVAVFLLAMAATDGTLPVLPGLLLMTAGGLWDALRTRRVNFGGAELRQPRT